MRSYVDGYRYGLEDPAGAEIQTVQLMGEGHTGTTNEEVLRMMVHRLKTQNTKLPCRENAVAITKLEEALMWIERRAKRIETEGFHKTE